MRKGSLLLCFILAGIAVQGFSKSSPLVLGLIMVDLF
jgi:hypothetical protein